MALGTIKGQSEDAEDDRGYRAGLYHYIIYWAPFTTVQTLVRLG